MSNKKLGTLLEEEIKRFNKIVSYQDDLSLNEVSYRFYTEEVEEEPIEEPAEEPMDDMGGEEPTEEPMDDEVTEIDVSDLVNNTQEINTKIESLNANMSKINDIMGKVNAIEVSLTKMDDFVNQIQALSKQVELMRPPTEEERRKALAKDSYPFNISMDDYNKGAGEKNQTELEDNSKMSMMDTLMNNYNEMDIKRSFNAPNENPFLKA